MADDLTDEQAARIRGTVDAQTKQFRRGLMTNRNKTFAIKLVTTLQRQVDAAAESAKRRPGVHFDCKAGCSYCCTLRIDAFPPEIFIIARHLLQLPDGEKTALIEKLRAHGEKASGVEMNDFYLTCPMLVEGQCSIYAIRPAMCRKYYSMDVEACKRPESVGIEEEALVLEAASLIYGAVQGYERAKLPMQAHELGQALHRAMTEPGLEDRWFKGETVFDPLP